MGTACKDFEELIQRELDGEILPADRTRLQAHMVSCAGCTTEREWYTKIDESLRRSSSPSAPRRDFAAEAVERATAMEVTAPRRIRRPVSPFLWAGLGVSAVVAVVALTVWLVLWGTRAPELTDADIAVYPELRIRLETTPTDEKKSPGQDFSVPRDPTIEELRSQYPFGQVDPIEELAEVNVKLAGTESALDRLLPLERGVVGLLDGFVDASARGDGTEAAQFGDALRLLVQDALSPVLGEIRRSARTELETLADRFSAKYERLMSFARALPLARKAEAERVLAFVAEARDATRAAARREGAMIAAPRSALAAAGQGESRSQPAVVRDLAGHAVRLARAKDLRARVEGVAASAATLSEAATAASGRMEEAVYYVLLALQSVEDGVVPLLGKVTDDDPANDGAYARAVETAARASEVAERIMSALPEDQQARIRGRFDSVRPKTRKAEAWMKERSERHERKDAPPDAPPDRDRRTPGGTRDEHNPH